MCIIFTNIVIFTIFINIFFFPSFFQTNYIFYYNYNTKFTGYTFFIYLIINSFKKLFIYCFIMDYIIVFYIIIIQNILNKFANYTKLKIVKSWLI